MKMGMLPALALAFLAGCSLLPPPIEPGTTTEAQILATYGPPGQRWVDTDGSRTLVFPTQPQGWSCLMVEVDPDGRVRNARDALSETNQARVEAGMTPAQVDRLLGPHRSEVFFTLSGEWVWDWNVPHYGPGIATYFNVHFKEGVVLRTSRNFVPGGPMGGFEIHPPLYLPCPRCQP